MQISQFHARRLSILGLAAFLTVAAPGISLRAQQAAPQHRPPAAARPARPAAHPATPAAQQTPKLKGIWEPINYPDDLSFEDVFFANDQVGWIAGKGPGGFILHTADGGAHWDLQLGDPHSDTPEVTNLYFLDATHGWAIQDDNLIRTTDGMTWETIGPFVAHVPLHKFQFTSAQDGIMLGGYATEATSIYATHDGGRSWKPVYQCAATIQVNGLTENKGCYLSDLYFVSSRVGYATGGGYNDHWAAIAKTTDGGESWKVIFASNDVDRIGNVFFTDENNGVVRLGSGQVLITADGGQNWRGATGAVQSNLWSELRFADPEVGWSCELGGNAGRCSYTVDGGKDWISRDFAFPASGQVFSIPRPDCICVVGIHGMIYRYREVPADYTAKGILDAPLMPAYGGVLRQNMDEMKGQIAALQAKLGAAGSAAVQPVVPDAPPARGGGPSFSLASYNQNAATGPADPDPNPQGFVQDVSDASDVAPSSFVQNCCATQVQSMQTSFTSAVQQVPTFNSQFRVLNLLSVAINMLSDLTNRAKQISTAFAALKQAPNLQAALAALGNRSTQVDGTAQAIDSQFQSLGAGQASGTPGGGFIGNQVVPAAPSTPGTAPANGRPPQP